MTASTIHGVVSRGVSLARKNGMSGMRADAGD